MIQHLVINGEYATVYLDDGTTAILHKDNAMVKKYLAII